MHGDLEDESCLSASSKATFVILRVGGYAIYIIIIMIIENNKNC